MRILLKNVEDSQNRVTLPTTEIFVTENKEAK